ncbi:MAG: asparaginase [Halobacteriota archaeon]|nr:asparaginase [Halobacteriota archaeon]
MNLVEVRRNGLVESVHKGSIAVTDIEGKLVASFGDPEDVTFMRSAAKPLQAIPVVEIGAAERFHLTDEEIAVMCGSHSGQPFHVEAVKSALSKIGLDERDLRCGARYPLHRSSANELILKKEEPGPVHNPCSGKHTGMLAISIFMGYPTKDYYEADHPAQQLILESISDMAEVGKDQIRIGIDGCGVPVHGIPLKNMALAFAKLASPRDLRREKKRAAERVVCAMQSHPEMVAGSGRLCTVLMHATKKIITKIGAEGVYCVGVPEKNIGIAVKIEDGGDRAIGPVVIEVLDQLGILSEDELRSLQRYHYHPVKTHQKVIIGVISPALKLNFVL